PIVPNRSLSEKRKRGLIANFSSKVLEYPEYKIGNSPRLYQSTAATEAAQRDIRRERIAHSLF
ncbi:hypothetical protein, partial [Barnesiella intestinihominis]|uniref:hypothetical protein n=1 Tax=Barnesiella intestinihominis TaxID=487174 RepID=UPI003AB73D26